MKSNGVLHKKPLNGAPKISRASRSNEDISTPMRNDAFNRSDEEKITLISEHMRSILETLGMDLTDDSLRDTPSRVAKMYVKEIFKGLNPENKPSVSLFDNKYQYNKMLVEKHITLKSACEHHLMPFFGHAHVGYISSGKVIGLSKINRLVDYYSRRPQVQERLNVQILEEMKHTLQTEDVIVMIEAKHMCVCGRGIQDDQSKTVTLDYSGRFHDESLRKEFLSLI